MLPLPAATTTITNIQPTSQPVMEAFMPYAYMEIGLFIGALVVVFIIYVFWDSIKLMVHRKSAQKFEIKNNSTKFN